MTNLITRTQSKWWRWPEDRRANLAPWFVIFRRVIFWPIIFALVFLATLATAAGYGVRDARRFWSEFV